MMDAIMAVLMAAMILEAILQVVKGWVPKDEDGKAKVPEWTWPLVGAALGVVLCLLGDVDLLETAGLYLSVPYVGCVLTGVLISRGASFVHDLWSNIKGGTTSELAPIEVEIKEEKPE